MPRHTVLVVVTALAAACRSRRQPPPPASTAHAPPATDSSPPARNDAALAALAAAHPTREVDASSAANGPPDAGSGDAGTTAFGSRSALAADPDGGAIAVWTAAGIEGHTDIVAQRVDADGVLVGTPRRLRRTNGTVVAIDADVREGVLHLAWIAPQGPPLDPSGDQPFGHNEHIVALVRAPANLSASSPAPLVLADFRPAQVPVPWVSRVVRVVAGDAGATFAVFTGAEQRCTYVLDPHDPASSSLCPTVHLASIDANGRITSLDPYGNIQPIDVPGSIVRLPDGVLYALAVPDAGGTATLRGTSRLVAEIGGFDAPRVAWNGSARVLVAHDRGSQPGDEDAYGVEVTNADRSLVTPTPGSGRAEMVTASTWRAVCVHGHPVVRIGWNGGHVDLDPTVAGASFRLGDFVLDADDGPRVEGERPRDVVWTGHALAMLRDGRIERWRCGRSGLVAEP